MRRIVFIFLLACSVALGAQTRTAPKRPAPRPAPRPVPSAAQSLPPGSFAAIQAVNASHIRADVKFLAMSLKSSASSQPANELLAGLTHRRSPGPVAGRINISATARPMV
jgi:hypothetical protein